jgi:hypothetical protein
MEKLKIKVPEVEHSGNLDLKDTKMQLHLFTEMYVIEAR